MTTLVVSVPGKPEPQGSGRGHKKATNEQIIATYKATGSVWATAERLGMAGQTVHERLRALDYPMVGRKWEPGEVEFLKTLVDPMTLSEIAHRLGRPYAGVALKVSRLGIGSNHGNRGPKKIKRGAGYDKESLKKYAREIDATGLSVHAYARRHKLGVEMLCQAFENRLPKWWVTYRENHSDLPLKTCEYCDREFIPSSKKQQYCTRKCGSDRRSDLSYFGGRRRETIGLAEGVCQLCGRSNIPGLSSHHILGKENDPDNEYLIALCQGCHQIVTLVSARNFVERPEVWEALIALCALRKRGAPANVYACVELEFVPDDELDEAVA
jgi:hypothetical protein